MTPTRASALPWDDLQVFVAVAQRGSVAGAASYLHVNHSTVLRRLDALERALGARLFDRLRDGYALTSTGSELARRLRGLQEQVDGAYRQALGMQEEIAGTIRLSSSDVVVESLLMPALAQFRRGHPGVRVELASGYSPASPAADDFDLAVRGADAAPPGLVASRVGDIQTVLCASPAYLRGIPADAPWSEHRWIVLDESLDFVRLGKWSARHVPASSIVARVDSIVGVADAVAAGLGIGLVPRALATGRRALVELAAPDAGLRKKIWLLMNPEVRHVARMKALFGYLDATLRQGLGGGRSEP